MRTLLLVVLASSAYGIEVEGIDMSPQSVEEEIMLIHDEMKVLEGLLRDDRVGGAVEVDGKEIIDALDKLIKEIEDAKETDKEPRGKSLSERWKKLRSLAGIGRGRGRTAPPKTGSGRLPEGNGYAADRWSKISNEKREAMIQSYSEEVPMKWRWRISAYFLSINANDKDRPAKNESQ